jgi:GNAT superfamily N-acetyltransferase
VASTQSVRQADHPDAAERHFAVGAHVEAEARQGVTQPLTFAGSVWRRQTGAVPGEIEIRDFRAGDERDTRLLILEGMRWHWGTLDPGFNHDVDDMFASYGHGRTVVAVDENRVVGTGTVVRRDSATAEIVRMSVAEEAQRIGVGRELVGTLLATASSWGCERVVLETSSQWAGVIEFYLRCGFTVSHEVDSESGRDTWLEAQL